MFVIAVTGGIASGKRTLTSYLEPAAAAVVDADKIAREIAVPGTETHTALVEHFGQTILDKEGAIDRGVLADIVFNDPTALTFINKITHPKIIERVNAELQRLDRELKREDIVILRAPLLVEVGMTRLADYCVVVEATEATRLNRMIINRDMTAEEAKSRINAQTKDEDRAKHADCVIKNEGKPDALKARAEEILATVRRLASSGK